MRLKKINTITTDIHMPLTTLVSWEGKPWAVFRHERSAKRYIDALGEKGWYRTAFTMERLEDTE